MVVRAEVVGVGAEVVGVVPSRGTTTDEDWGTSVDPDDCTPEVPAVFLVDFFFTDAVVDDVVDRSVDVVTDECVAP